MNRIACAVTLALALCLPDRPVTAQSLLDRTPNLSGGWIGSSGIVHFHFLHRFTTSGAPERQVLNSPTFLLAYSPLPRALIGTSYATRSDITPRFPNEWELFGRYALMDGIAVQGGYNNAAESLDGEVTVAREFSRLRLIAAGRVLSSAFASDSTRFAVAGGALVRISRWVSVGADVATLIDAHDHEDVAWGAALQIAIPTTPHTLSLQAANTTTATLQGASRGAGSTRYGFEFTVPITLARLFGPRPAASVNQPAAVIVSMKGMKFSPAVVTVAAGQRVTWRNDDQVAHTVTAQDGSWTSRLLEAGATYTHTFSQPGRVEIICTPHPFMKSVVEVRP